MTTTAGNAGADGVPAERAATRAEGIDVVRALALLGSAIATALLWLHARQLGPGYRPLDSGPADRVADLVTALLVDNRVLAVFALLLGHGLAGHAHRLRGGSAAGSAAGGGAVAGLSLSVLRRAAVLVGLGALHALLVLEADVLAVLGLVLVLGIPLVGAGVRTHIVVGVIALPALLLSGAADGLGGTAGFPDPPSDYLLSAIDRVGTWLLALVLLPFTQLGLLISLVAGIRLARGGWLLAPRAHRRALLWLGSTAAVLGLLGGVPYAQVVVAVGPDAGTAVLAGVVSSLSGPLAALGLVCLTVLLVDLLPDTPGPLRTTLAALGRRSLPAYLAQSVVLALVLAPWAAGLGGVWGSAQVVALGCAVWVATLLMMMVPAWSTPGPGGQSIERQGLARSAAT